MNQLKQFKCVAEIAKYGSISKAAKALNIAQSTLSKYLSKLEDELGLTLFDRTTIPIKPTEAGERYLVAGKRIIETHQKLERDFDMLKQGPSKTLKIGLSPTRAHFILTGLIEKFYESNNDTKLVVVEKTVAQLNDDLQRGELDMIISLKCDGTKQFEAVPLFLEKLILAVPKKYKDKTTEEILKECPIISTGTGLHISNALLDVLYEYKREEPLIEVQSIESALSLANIGLGICLVPSYVKNYNQYENIFFIEIPEDLKVYKNLNFNRQICAFYRKGETLREAEKEIIKACKSIL